MIKIKMVDENLTKLGGDITGEWFDLRASSIKNVSDINGRRDVPRFEDGKPFVYKAGDSFLIGLGLAVELPEGYEAIVSPRSGLFINYGVTLTNSIGVIDNTYRGEWMANVIAHRDGKINWNDRLLQFRIQKQQPQMEIVFVDKLSETERGTGGFNSTGVK